MNCAYCYERNKANDHLSTSDAIKILKHVYSDIASPAYVEIIGGEPLLNWPVFLDICKYNTTRTKFLSTITNGTLLSKSIIKSLIEHKVLVGISYDGKSAHDIYRRDNNLFGTEQLVKNNILTALNMGLKIVINVAFHKANAQTIYDDIIELINCGVSKFKIHTVNNINYKAHDKVKYATYDKLSALAMKHSITMDLKLNISYSNTDHYYYFKNIIKHVKKGMLGKWESVSWDNNFDSEESLC